MSGTKLQKLTTNSFLFRLYLLKSLPMGFIAGIRVKLLTDETCSTTIKFKWLTQNPFKSMYFACQAMAAEMSTGLLVMDRIVGATQNVSMLIVKNEAEYFKKATGKITFTCNDGNQVSAAITQTKQTGEGVVLPLKSIGRDQTGEIVSEFIFTWSLKLKVK